MARVGSVDEVHRDAQLAVDFTAGVDADDVGMPHPGDEIGLAEKPVTVVIVVRDPFTKDLQGVLAGPA